MNFKNYYLSKKSGNHHLTQQQMQLINDIICQFDNNFKKYSIESRPYELGSLINPIYLASKEEAYVIVATRRKEISGLAEMLTQEIEMIKHILKQEFDWDEDQKDNPKDDPKDDLKKDLIEKLNILKKIKENTKNEPINGRLEQILRLGWFNPETQEIFICLDAIIELADYKQSDADYLIAAVVLHELSHARMHNPTHLGYETLGELWLEESLANKIMLYYIDFYCKQNNIQGKYTQIENFVSSQPDAYKLGSELMKMKSSDWAVFQDGKGRLNNTFSSRINSHNNCDWLIIIKQLLDGNKIKQNVINNYFYRCFLMAQYILNGKSIPYSRLEHLLYDNNYPNNYPNNYFNPLLNTIEKTIIDNIININSKQRQDKVWCGLNSTSKQVKVVGPEQWHFNRSYRGSYYTINIEPSKSQHNPNKNNSISTLASFDTEEQAENCIKYLETKFVRFFVAYFIVKYHTKRFATDVFLNVLPAFDFSSNSEIDWSRPLDPQLYELFQLDQGEIRFIEDTIK